MSVYQALMLMIAFATLILALNNKDKKERPTLASLDVMFL
ncbi:putative holin-like toxin [Lactococcus lactis]|nr:putative holin-like toxin [Lactococcus lactis]